MFKINLSDTRYADNPNFCCIPCEGACNEPDIDTGICIVCESEFAVKRFIKKHFDEFHLRKAEQCPACTDDFVNGCWDGHCTHSKHTPSHPEREYPDYVYGTAVNPDNNPYNCWFCHQDVRSNPPEIDVSEDVYFSVEFDTYFHMDCLISAAHAELPHLLNDTRTFLKEFDLLTKDGQLNV